MSTSVSSWDSSASSGVSIELPKQAASSSNTSSSTSGGVLADRHGHIPQCVNHCGPDDFTIRDPVPSDKTGVSTCLPARDGEQNKKTAGPADPHITRVAAPTMASTSGLSRPASEPAGLETTISRVVKLALDNLLFKAKADPRSAVEANRKLNDQFRKRGQLPVQNR